MRPEPVITSNETIRTRVRIDWLAVTVQLSPLLLALLLWSISLKSVDLSKMADLGLVTVLPVSFYAALFVLTISFAIQAYRQQSLPMLFLHIVALIFIIHGTPQILYGTIRYSWAWKHIGIIDYIQRNGSVDPYISYLNVYQNWPGFFSFGALINELSGIDSARIYAGWSPVFFNLLDIGPLILIFRSLTRDQRLIFTGTWFFYLGNWIGQDYFSPQAMAYFLYLVILAIVLRWLRVTRIPDRVEIQRLVKSSKLAAVVHKMFIRTVTSGNPDTSIDRFQRAGLTVILIIVFVAITTSHQLTPFMAITALIALTIFPVFSGKRVPLLFIILTVTWIVYMATAFLNGNLPMMISSIGSLLGNLNGNLVNLQESSPSQVLISFMDRGLTAFVIGLALLGILTRLRPNTWDIPAVLLLITPLPLLAANAYGGEILFRVFYFCLPFLAFFAAALFYPKISSGHSFSAVIIIYISLIMLAGFVFAYYGKENMNYFPPQEVTASDYLHQIAPQGSLIMDGTPNWPFLYKNYEEYTYLSISTFDQKGQQKILSDPVNSIAQIMSNYPAAYLVLNHTQFAEEHLTYELPPGSLEHIQALLVSSPRFKVLYQNPDAVIITLNPAYKGGK